MIANLTAKAKKFHIPPRRTMNWVNQQTVWIFGLVAGSATIGSFIIAFIVNRERLGDFVRKYWFLVVGLVALFGLWSLYHYGILASWAQKLGKFMGVSVPIWAGITAIAIVGFCWWMSRNIRVTRVSDEQVQQNPSESPAQITSPKPAHRVSRERFHVRDYVEDLIDGVWWQWTYSGNIVNTPRPLCPNQNCKCDLSFREDWDRAGYNFARGNYGEAPVTLSCPRCHFSLQFDKAKNPLLYEITQEILSRLRTERFRDILCERESNRRKNG
ncbi:MAG TPA: hypothetical protein VG347_19065 [Verrucomicrobiae bacterium]|nr:hypothetical protein [Verrucomicrobiae bacterium]